MISRIGVGSFPMLFGLNAVVGRVERRNRNVLGVCMSEFIKGTPA